MPIHPLAGTRPEASMLVDIPRLITSYSTLKPDAAVPGQWVSFGTSGHRRSSSDRSFMGVAEILVDHHLYTVSGQHLEC